MLFLGLGAIPAIPLVVANGHLVSATFNALLLLCVAALWCERERRARLPHPIHFGGEARLAA
jgi:hypothetical protein